MAEGSIVTGEPKWNDRHGAFVVLRRFFCDHCVHIVSWLEASTESGEPTGRVVSGPGFTRGSRSIDKFLKQHPQCQGVIP